jgi:hypothetical protein
VTGKQRPFAHLPRTTDETAQVRALLDAVGADWEFLGRYEYGVDCHEELDIPVGGGEPAKAHRVKHRPIREIMQEHGIPEPSKEVQQARVDFVTRKPMGNE